MEKKRVAINLALFLVVGLFIFGNFVHSDIFDRLISDGLENRQIIDESPDVLIEDICPNNDLFCLIENIEEFCQGESECLDEINSIINYLQNENNLENQYDEFRPLENPISNLGSVKQVNILEDLKKRIISDKELKGFGSASYYKISWWQKFLNYLRDVKLSFTGNVVRINSEDFLELPDLPSAPDDSLIDEVTKPKLSLGKFRIFNFLTGNAIIGIPDWSFDGVDIEKGNFIWEAKFTEQQGKLQHFDLKLDINFSKEDSNGKTPVNGIVNQVGYYLDENKGKWVPFNFSGTEIWSTDEKEGKNIFTGWLRAGMHGQPVPSASLTLEDHTKSDYSIFLTYSCLKFFEQSWECNEGRWVVHVVETGDVDYHSIVGEMPAMGYTEVKDLDISDVPSILKQFNVSLFDFQPPLHDIFITSANSDINVQKGNSETLEFYVKNFGNRNLTGIHFELDIGERSLAEVVYADLPQTLAIGEMKKGSITVLFKEEHTQKITLWVKPSEAEVDTSDNLASYNIVVGKKPTMADVPERVPYHGNTGEIIVNWSKIEPYEKAQFGDSSLEVLSGVDKMRTIWGGYWNGTSINPTMELYVVGMMTEEALFSTPFLSSISMGGKLLIGDREIVEYKIRFTNSRTGVYYETPIMQDSYIYHYNPKQLIPDFEWCTDYIIEYDLTGTNHETVDVIQKNDVLNVCNVKLGNAKYSFKSERLLKQDGNYVVIKPHIGSVFLSNDIRYFVEFEDPRSSGKFYRTPVLNLKNGVEFVPVADIFGTRSINYNSGEVFNGKIVLMDSLVFKDLEQYAFGDKYRVVGRDCRAKFNDKDIYGFAGMVGLENWMDFNSNRAYSDDNILCYDDNFYYCGSSSYLNSRGYNQFSTQVSSNQGVGSWKCVGNKWVRDGKDFVEVSVDLNKGQKKIEKFVANKTYVDCNGNLTTYVKKGTPAVYEGYILLGNVSNISSLFDRDIKELAEGNNYKDYENYYFVCSGDLDIFNQTINEERVVYEGGDNSYNKELHFMWNGWDIGINIIFNNLVSLKLRDELIGIFYPSGFRSILGNNFMADSFLTFPYRGESENYDSPTYLKPSYMDSQLYNVILRETEIKGVLYDLTEDKSVFDYVGSAAGNCYSEDNIFLNCNSGYFNFFTRFKILTEGKMKNGHFYEIRVSVASKNAGLYKAPQPIRLFYVDGWNFILNNELLYSRFFEMQNYPVSVLSYVSKKTDIPTVEVSFGQGNVYFDSCEGYYKKFNDLNERYIDLVGGCVYPEGTYISFEGSKKAIFSSMKMKIYPVKSLDIIETQRTNFNCKIGKFDGICNRDNSGYQFIYFDMRTGLVYDVKLTDGEGKFIVKYRDASENGTKGNSYDALIYDILTQIDQHPIRDFEIDYKYKNPPSINTEYASYSSYISHDLEYFYKEPSIVLENLVRTPFPKKFVIYDDKMNFIGINELFFGKRLNPISSEYSRTANFNEFFSDNDLSSGKYFYTIKDYLLNPYHYYYFYHDFIWTKDYPKWFFEDMGWGKYVNIYNENSQFNFYNVPFFRNNDYKDIENLRFYFNMNPKNWSVVDTYTQENLKKDLNYYFCVDCDWNSNNISAIVDERKKNVTNYISPGVSDISGGISRDYVLNVYQKDSLYDWYNVAPKNCKNAHDSDEFRDVVCSSKTEYRYNINGLGQQEYFSTSNFVNSSYYQHEGGRFIFTCSWANINELKTYSLTMNQVFYNRIVEQVNNLPTETIKEMRDEFFYPVLRAHLEALPPTPILDTTYGTFYDVDVRKTFCV